MQIDGKWIKLQIWDTAGQERFRTITSAYYRGATGILLVYDVTDATSFANVRSWLRNVEQHANEGVARVLVGNKADAPESRRAVSREAGQALADEIGVPFFETSAKSGANVDEAFKTLARIVMSRQAAEGGGPAGAGAGAAGAAGQGGVRLGAPQSQPQSGGGGCC